MPLSPETFWEDIVSQVGNVRGGKRWYSDFEGMDATNEYIQFPDMVHLDCSAFNENVNIDYEHAFTTEPIITFSNGSSVVLKCWMQLAHDGLEAHPRAEAVLVNGNNVIRSLGDCPGFISGSISWGTSLIGFKQTGIKACVVTEYIGYSTQQAGGVLEGITTADAVSVYILWPFSWNVWPYIEAGGNRYIMKFKADSEAAYTEPSGFFYPGMFAEIYRSFLYSVFRFTDLDDMYDLVSSQGALDPDDVYHIGPSSDDPVQDDDPSVPGGGGGSYDKTSDPIPFPSLPTNGAIDSGAVQTFVVDKTRIVNIFAALWNTSIFDIQNFQKLLEAPLDSLISLQCAPITPTAGAGANIQLGNFNTQVTAPVVTQQYYTIDFGSIKIPEFWGSALDYSPYTTFEIFLPGIGIKEVQIEDVMKATLKLKYNYDILTGNFVALLMCGQSVLYHWPGNIEQTIPVTSKVNDAIQRLIGGNIAQAAAAVTGSGAGLAMATIGAAVNVAMSKTHVSKSGSISGSTGVLDDFEPYIIIHRPIQSLAQNFKTFKGYPSNMTAILNTLSGYTEVEYVHLTGIDGATDAELSEIENLLKKGVLL